MAVDSTGCPNQPAVAGNRAFANLSQVCKTLFQVVFLLRPLRRGSASPPSEPTATAAPVARISRYTSARERGSRYLEAPSTAQAALAYRWHLCQTDPY